MTMTRANSILLAGGGVAVLIAAHGVVAWGGVTLSSKTGGWLPWIGGSAVAVGLYHLVQAFGVYHVVRHIRGRGHSHALPGGNLQGRAAVARGPHDGFLVDLNHGFVELTLSETDAPRFRLFLYDKHKQARPVPRNATITIETVRTGDERQTFTFHSNGEYLESMTDVPSPHEFMAVVHVSHGKHAHSHEVQFSS